MSVVDPLVSTDWLADHLEDPGVKVIDGSWRMPGAGEAIDDYNKRHIAGALYFNIDAIADTKSALPHMLPSREIFEDAVGAIGLTERDFVIIYDDKGIFSAARVWWTFRTMGHQNVAVLDGGLPKWLSEKRPVTAYMKPAINTVYTASPVRPYFVCADEVREALANNSADVADARPAARFCGQAPEPRTGLHSGGMPGAISLPFQKVLTEAGIMHAPDKLRDIFSAAGINLSKPVITTCGSGVTAAVLSLALECAGCRHHSLYDGSWAEWGDKRNDRSMFPVKVGGQVDEAR